MALGVVVPLVVPGLPGILIAALLVGSTFMVITMVGLQEGRRLAGPDPRDPTSYVQAQMSEDSTSPLRIAWSPDWDRLAVDPGAGAPLELYFGGLNLLASHPWMSDVMGSLDTTAVSTRSLRKFSSSGPRDSRHARPSPPALNRTVAVSKNKQNRWSDCPTSIAA